MRPWLYEAGGIGGTTNPPATTLWRGLNNSSTTSAHIIDAHYPNAFRFKPSTTWTRVGDTTRFTFTVDIAAYRDTITSIRAVVPNAYIIVDPHTFPGCHNIFTCHAEDGMWWDPNYTLNMVDWWNFVSNALSDLDNIGYDILNEPNEPLQANGLSYPKLVTSIPTATIDQLFGLWNYSSRPLTNPAANWVVGGPDPRSWAHKADVCTAAIRANDTENEIFIGMAYGGGAWATGTGGTGISMGTNIPRNHNTANWYLPNDSNLVISPHFYDPSSYTGDFDQGVPGGVSRPTHAQIVNNLADVRAWTLQHPTVPVFIGEVGAKYNADEVDLYVADILDYIESLGWSWLYHVINHKGLIAGFDAYNNDALMAVLRTRYDRNQIN